MLIAISKIPFLEINVTVELAEQRVYSQSLVIHPTMRINLKISVDISRLLYECI